MNSPRVAPGFVAAGWFESGRDRVLIGELPAVVCLSFSQRYVADLSGTSAAPWFYVWACSYNGLSLRCGSRAEITRTQVLS